MKMKISLLVIIIILFTGGAVLSTDDTVLSIDLSQFDSSNLKLPQSNQNSFYKVGDKVDYDYDSIYQKYKNINNNNFKEAAVVSAEDLSQLDKLVGNKKPPTLPNINEDDLKKAIQMMEGVPEPFESKEKESVESHYEKEVTYQQPSISLVDEKQRIIGNTLAKERIWVGIDEYGNNFKTAQVSTYEITSITGNTLTLHPLSIETTTHYWNNSTGYEADEYAYLQCIYNDNQLTDIREYTYKVEYTSTKEGEKIIKSETKGVNHYVIRNGKLILISKDDGKIKYNSNGEVESVENTSTKYGYKKDSNGNYYLYQVTTDTVSRKTNGDYEHTLSVRTFNKDGDLENETVQGVKKTKDNEGNPHYYVMENYNTEITKNDDGSQTVKTSFDWKEVSAEEFKDIEPTSPYTELDENKVSDGTHIITEQISQQPSPQNGNRRRSPSSYNRYGSPYNSYSSNYYRRRHNRKITPSPAYAKELALIAKKAFEEGKLEKAKDTIHKCIAMYGREAHREAKHVTSPDQARKYVVYNSVAYSYYILAKIYLKQGKIQEALRILNYLKKYYGFAVWFDENENKWIKIESLTKKLWEEIEKKGNE